MQRQIPVHPESYATFKHNPLQRVTTLNTRYVALTRTQENGCLQSSAGSYFGSSASQVKVARIGNAGMSLTNGITFLKDNNLSPVLVVLERYSWYSQICVCGWEWFFF